MDQSDKNILKTVLILLFAILVYVVFSRCANASGTLSFEWNAPREVYAAKLDRFLESYFAKCNPRKLANARKLAPIVLDASERHGVNPAIIAAIVSHESTWNYGAIGKLGEVGLMQVNNRPVGKEPAEQLDAGIEMLKAAHARCGSVLGAISLYATGRSCKPYRGAELRVKLAQKIEAL